MWLVQGGVVAKCTCVWTKVAGNSETREYVKELCLLLSEVPFMLSCFESTCFKVLCNCSSVVGAGGTEDL